MYENKINDAPVKAVLVCVDTGEFDAEISIAELSELAYSANAEVVGEVIQKKSSYDSATCMGSGRLEELREQLSASPARLGVSSIKIPFLFFSFSLTIPFTFVPT